MSIFLDPPVVVLTQNHIPWQRNLIFSARCVTMKENLHRDCDLIKVSLIESDEILRSLLPLTNSQSRFIICSFLLFDLIFLSLNSCFCPAPSFPTEPSNSPFPLKGKGELGYPYRFMKRIFDKVSPIPLCHVLRYKPTIDVIVYPWYTPTMTSWNLA